VMDPDAPALADPACEKVTRIFRLGQPHTAPSSRTGPTGDRE
jgi:hypothetical protein